MRVIASCLSSLLLIGLAATPARAADAPPVRINIGLADPGDAPLALALLGDRAGRSKPVTGLSAITVEVPADSADGALAALTADTAHVRYAERDGVVHADSDPFDENNRGQYDYDRVGEAKSWGAGSPSVVVAVVDSGVSSNVDLPASRLTAGYDFVDGDADPADDDDHGTMVATLIAGEADNGAGSSGVCSRCGVMPVRVLSHRTGGAAEGSSADVAAGIVWAAEHGAQVINVSASTATPSRLLTEAVERATAKGSLVVAAAGNAGSTAREYPAAIEPALAVGSELLGQTGFHTNLNSYADRWIDIAAAQALYTMDRKSGNRYLYDTSASSAVIAGVAALGFSAKNNNTTAQVRAALLDGAVRSPHANQWDPAVVDAAYAVHRLGGVDTAKPVITATGLTAGQTLTQAVITPEVTDDHAIARLEEIAGGRVVAESSGPDWKSLYAQAPENTRGDVPITIRAYDYAGNYDEMTTVVKVDTTFPVASIVTPVAGAHVRSGPVPVRVRAAAPVSEVYFWSENGPRIDFTQVAGTNDWVGTALPYPQGSFQVDVKGANGYTIVLPQQLVIDDSGPTATGLTPATNGRVRGTFTSTISGVADGAGIARAELWANGKRIGADTTAPYSLAVPTGTANGYVNLVWKLTDKLGNTRDYTRRVIADNAGPTVSISKAPGNKAKVKGTVTVSVKASDPSGVGRVELLVNGKVVARDYRSSYVLSVNTARQAKTMKIQIRAYDRLGNVRVSSTRIWYRK
ncbi:S8 family serine peptidase [Actinoplanes sp. HUAS TT8]|uniref:S8 family serine peptidase n=1 Tax=Actinoplanes sp. HUAS TT8 TaxID=3447453 RepID=UPI003F52523E